MMMWMINTKIIRIIISVHLGTRRSGRLCQRPVTVSRAFRMVMVMLMMNVMTVMTVMVIIEIKQWLPQQLHVLSKNRQFLRRHRFWFQEPQPEVLDSFKIFIVFDISDIFNTFGISNVFDISNIFKIFYFCNIFLAHSFSSSLTFAFETRNHSIPVKKYIELRFNVGMCVSPQLWVDCVNTEIQKYIK